MEKLRIALHFLLLLPLLQGSLVGSLLQSDEQALLDFADRINHLRPLNWKKAEPACKNWTGITCNEDGSRVVSVRLPGFGFHGSIPDNTLSRLSALQILSLRSNRISGEFPQDFGNLRNLSFLYLQNNNFSGPLPLNFFVWSNLTIVNLSNNGFNGTIPSSLNKLSQLVSLNLAHNSLSGEIPDLHLPKLQSLNLSHNKLVGSLPKSLKIFPKSAFGGNDESLLDYSVGNSPLVLAPREHKPRNAGKLSERALLGIIITGSVLGLLGFGFMLLVCLLRQQTIDDGFPAKLEKGYMTPEKAISRSEDANNKLVFFEGCNYAFDLEDLLRASAEVLGKGTFGTAYKAILEDATMVVVKRLKDVNVGKREFEQQMDIIGSIKHENVTELRAYYYSKDEKLMVYDYYSQGSLALMLYGKRGDNHKPPPLDWKSRLNIALGAARGIARIHAENGGKLAHGNVKSSNIFLNPHNLGCISDLGLSAIMSSLSPSAARASGYRAPEVTDTRKATQPSDVYSFGVILLELLTGKSPVYATSGDEIIQLVRWVHSVVREEWTAEVFDVELLRFANIDEELVEMLQIALSCVVRLPEQRPKMEEVAKMIEDVRISDSTNRGSSEAEV